MKILFILILGIVLLGTAANSNLQNSNALSDLSENETTLTPIQTVTPTPILASEKAVEIATSINQVLDRNDWIDLMKQYSIVISKPDEEIKEYALWMDNNQEALSINEAAIQTYLSQTLTSDDSNQSLTDTSNYYSKPSESTPAPKINIHGGTSSYHQIGNGVFGSDGSNYQQVGNTVFGNDGSTYQRIGNSIFSNDGESYQQIGNTTFGSDGSTYQQVGNTSFASDGTICQQIGSNTFCN